MAKDVAAKFPPDLELQSSVQGHLKKSSNSEIVLRRRHSTDLGKTLALNMSKTKNTMVYWFYETISNQSVLKS